VGTGPEAPGPGPYLAMVLDADTFFAEVDRHITPPMVRLGYHRLPASTGTSSRSTPLTSQANRKRGLTWLRHLRRTSEAPERVYTVGYEAADEDVARRLEPQDPANADELWIRYYPATGDLDLSSWHRLLTSDPGWDIGDVDRSSNDADLVRRISLCGEAVAILNS
jgi:hypothetical protein